MSPIIRECARRRINFYILHTNQHYAKNLNEIFFEELNLPQPRYNLNVGSGTQAEETGKMLIRIERVLMEERPDIVLVEGDTNTVVSGALAAAKLQIRVGHVEAGLRSFNRDMPEELNRIITDHLADYLFAPTKITKENLIHEGILNKKIFITGNTIVDAIYQNLKIAKQKAKILKKLNLRKENYLLATIHRQENVDLKDRFQNLLEGIGTIYKEFSLPISYPIHPRSQKRMDQFKLRVPEGVEFIKPVGYFDFLVLEQNAKLILTDSGGIQEEACILKVPCVTLRTSTERPETLAVGANKLAGGDPEKILSTAKVMLNKKRDWINLFGDGRAAVKIINILKNFYEDTNNH